MKAYVWEVRKLVAQRRTFIGLGAAVLIPILFATGFALSPPDGDNRGRTPDAGDVLVLAYNTSGLLLPFIGLAFASLVLLPLLAALVAGDIVASEDTGATLKTVLTRSTSRTGLLVAKMGAAATYIVALLAVYGVSATLIGTLAVGAKPVTLGGPMGAAFFGAPTFSVGSMLVRILLALAAYAAPLLAVSAWGFLLSTVTRNSSASIVGMLVFSFVNQILRFIPNVPEAVGTWLLTDQFTAWQGALGASIDWSALGRSTGVSAIYLVVPLLVSVWFFRRRDILV